MANYLKVRALLLAAAAVVLAGSAALGAEPTAVKAPAPPTVILAGNVWDGLADAPLGPMEILVQGGKITAMGKAVARPAGARIVDLSTKTVMPGFIDCHVHVTLRPQFEDALLSLSPAAKALLGVEALRILLGNGFTTVRDVSDMDFHGYTTVDLKRAVARGSIEGPRLLVAPHLISATSGHGDGSTLLSADNFPVNSVIWQNNIADGPDEIRKVVRSEVNRGADWIKFAATGGFSSPADDPGQTSYSQEEMNVLVATARDLGRAASPHAYGDEGIARALRAGVRTIEHGNLASAETLAQMEKQGVFIVPTQFAVIRQARLIDDDEFWKEAGKPPYVRAKYRKYAKELLASAKNLAASKVKIALGTDLGTYSFEQNGAQEFGEMAANGIAAVRALKAGTSVAAELLGLSDVGVLAVGKSADIVAMPGNPFADIRITEKVDFVMKEGAIYRQP